MMLMMINVLIAIFKYQISSSFRRAAALQELMVLCVSLCGGLKVSVVALVSTVKWLKALWWSLYQTLFISLHITLQNLLKGKANIGSCCDKQSNSDSTAGKSVRWYFPFNYTYSTVSVYFFCFMVMKYVDLAQLNSFIYEQRSRQTLQFIKLHEVLNRNVFVQVTSAVPFWTVFRALTHSCSQSVLLLCNVFKMNNSFSLHIIYFISESLYTQKLFDLVPLVHWFSKI